MIFTGLTGNELITITAPLIQETAEYTLVNIGQPLESSERYVAEFKGPTAIRVERTSAGKGDEGYYKGQEDHNWYRLFRREHMRSDQVPTMPLPAYIHGERVIRWTVV